MTKKEDWLRECALAFAQSKPVEFDAYQLEYGKQHPVPQEEVREVKRSMKGIAHE